MSAAELTEFFAEGLEDMQATAGIAITLTRPGVTGTAELMGTYTPGAATYSVEVSGNIFAVQATAELPVAACAATALGAPRIGDRLGVSGDARRYKVVGVRGSTLDPAWHLDLSETAAE